MYTPFEKNLENLDEAELNRLIENKISESWYVELKSDIPKTNSKIDKHKIVRTVTSFANTKGGWVFYGVRSDSTNTATELCGVDLTDFGNIADQLSRIIADNVEPKPFYHLKL